MKKVEEGEGESQMQRTGEHNEEEAKEKITFKECRPHAPLSSKHSVHIMPLIFCEILNTAMPFYKYREAL